MRLRFSSACVLIALLGGGTMVQAMPDYGWYLTDRIVSKKVLPSCFQIGMGATAGMTGNQIVYVSGPALFRTMYVGSPNCGSMQRNIPLEAWRGKRVRLSLRMKDEVDARPWVTFRVNNEDGSGLLPLRVQRNAQGGEWEVHQFTVDVPANAANLIVDISFSRKGTVWVDGGSLEAVGTDVAVSETRLRRAQTAGLFARGDDCGGACFGQP